MPESALLWQQHLQTTLIDLGLNPIPGVNCLFSNRHLKVFFYVDDIIVLYHERDSIAIQKFEEKMMEKYELKPFGQISHFLGIRVVRNEREQKISLVQDSYVESIVNEFKIVINEVKTQSTPSLLRNEDNSWAISDIDKANLFGEYLSNIFTPHDIILNNNQNLIINQSLNAALPVSLPAKPTSPGEIDFIIKKLHKKKSSGL